LPNAGSPIKQLSIAAGFIGIATSTEMEAAERLVQRIRDLQKEIGEPFSLKEFGIRQSLKLIMPSPNWKSGIRGS
jgi:alcohol dehydrogenase class IV